MNALPFPSPASIHWRGAPTSSAARATPPRRPPFGLAAWSDDEGSPAIALALDVPESWPPSGMGDAQSIAAQLPDPSTLASGTLLVVLGESAHERGILGKLLMRRAPSIARATRGSALLARGYTKLGGGIDPASGLDVAWGYAPSRAVAPP